MNNQEDIIWNIIDRYFKDNPDFLTKHHLNSYNDFINKGIPTIFRENNPIKILKEQDEKTKEFKLQCFLYLGGKNGDKIYYGKPIIYDENNYKHYMFPNEARLRNMNYSFSIHYDIEVQFSIFNEATENYENTNINIERQLLGRFPIMLKSDLCILKGLDKETCFNMGECRNDPGGYFIIDGKEKAIICQEKFANNMLNIKKHKEDDEYSHSVNIKTESEDSSKPVRTMAVRLVAPTKTQKNGQVVVNVPNVRKPIPLFILMRALGIISDKDIIKNCLLDMKKYENYIDLFAPSVYDAGYIFSQEDALQYISTFTKQKTIPSTMNILMDYFLPNIGELNFKQKAYFLGYMVKRMFSVYLNYENPTDRDNFKYKRVELSGKLLHDLFVEYYKLQLRDIYVKIDSKYYYHKGTYINNFMSLITDNQYEYFNNRIVETGFQKAFKGNWGAQAYTKRAGVVQDLNRLSFLSFIAHLRKLNLPLDSSAKVVGPRLLHTTQWGIICPLHTPDGGNIGLHKHLAIMAHITSGCSSNKMIDWFNKNNMKSIQLLKSEEMETLTKVFINGNWTGCINNPVDIVDRFKLERRNGLIPIFNSINWDIRRNEIYVNTDGGRLCRPIFYIDNNKPSYERIYEKIVNNDFTWEQLISGISKKAIEFNYEKCKFYNQDELYNNKNEDFLSNNSGIIDYMDTAECEGSLITMDNMNISKFNTHIEIHPSLALSCLANLIIFAENNQLPRDLYSCGQSKQGVSIYNTNFVNRIDKTGIVLNYGENPLVKSRYSKYITNEEHPYGENAIVAIMCYNGYNVEDALIFNESAVKRGLFRTTYYNMYESHEEQENVGGGQINSYFGNINEKNVVNKKPGYDYNYLDENGLIKENTKMNDKLIVIGKYSNSSVNLGVLDDESIAPKKGQLGFVDKAFITEEEEGKRIAKVRIREERIPAIGDKFCSRAGQKGTIGILLPEEDMPFTKDGIKPDLIVNPHAIPSRMTIGQLVECIMGKSNLIYGGFGDCTPFVNKGPKNKLYGSLLAQQGFHSSGTEVLYNGMTGEQLEANIFIGPTYYLRLKHMVKDKINYRSKGPRAQLTRQTIGGRAKDGGLRIGEMERDVLISHGINNFLQESMLTRGDEYYMAICNKSGAIAIYNENKNIFLSPFADGPIKFNGNLEGNMNIENVSKYGRSFSIVKVPYTFKLLIQELQTMNIQLRVITEDNVEQLTNLSYNNNQIKLNTGVDNYNELLENYKSTISGDKLPKKKYISQPSIVQPIQMEPIQMEPIQEISSLPEYELPIMEPRKETPEYIPPSPTGVSSPAFDVTTPEEPRKDTPEYNPSIYSEPGVESPGFQVITPDSEQEQKEITSMTGGGENNDYNNDYNNENELQDITGSFELLTSVNEDENQDENQEQNNQEEDNEENKLSNNMEISIDTNDIDNNDDNYENSLNETSLNEINEPSIKINSLDELKNGTFKITKK